VLSSCGFKNGHLAGGGSPSPLLMQQGHHGAEGSVQTCQGVPQGDVGPDGGAVVVPVYVPGSRRARQVCRSTLWFSLLTIRT